MEPFSFAPTCTVQVTTTSREYCCFSTERIGGVEPPLPYTAKTRFTLGPIIASSSFTARQGRNCTCEPPTHAFKFCDV